ncbi:MAG: hypothetical protein JXR97_05460 [Planctomycetes bacterium]|nr:hypothetical protein [Planctomycetota bacterium]
MKNGLYELTALEKLLDEKLCELDCILFRRKTGSWNPDYDFTPFEEMEQIIRYARREIVRKEINGENK